MFVNFCTFFICFAYKLADCFAINLILYECSFTSMVQSPYTHIFVLRLLPLNFIILINIKSQVF